MGRPCGIVQYQGKDWNLLTIEGGKVKIGLIGGTYKIWVDASAVSGLPVQTTKIVTVAQTAAFATMRCRGCGCVGRIGAYPFSTCPRTGLCDDCL